MPAYDFQCRKCGKLFEARLTMAEYSAGTRPICPDCGDTQPARSFAAPISIVKANRPDVSITTGNEGSCCGPGGGGCGCG